ncbi:transposase [Cytophaga aurantiaca]|uniref:transposase n=1 Tax=Cytophaga aurantiaca TaxID=29530 RepID=UPI0003741197|nr:transposase [Cytophaga aurantiaca]
MLQKPLLPETVYHVYTHANGFENLFNSEENYRFFLKKYTHYIYPIAETYAYCLMPNHLHLMIRIRSEKEVSQYMRLKKTEKLKESGLVNESHNDEETLQGFQTLGEFSNIISSQFSHLFNGYTQAFNKMYSRKGSLFIPNFKRKKANNENYMTHLICYIHNNPIHHGFVKNLNDWTFSSFHTYLSDKQTNLNKKYMRDWFGKEEQFIKFHKNSKLPYKLMFEE